MITSNFASMRPPAERLLGAAVELPDVKPRPTGTERAYALPLEAPPVAGGRIYGPVSRDRLQLESRVRAGGEAASPPPSARNLGESGWQNLIRFGNRIYAAGGHIEAAQQALGAIPGAVMQPQQFFGAVANAGKTLGKAGVLSAVIAGGMSLFVHGLRVISGQETLGQATRVVSVDVGGALAGGVMAAASAGAVAALFGAMGVGGMALGVLGAITGWLGYGWGEQQGRSIMGRLIH